MCFHLRENGDGWQSQRGCQYPQTLVLKIHHLNEKHVVHRLEILCHECKIPEKIDITLGFGSIQDWTLSSINQCEIIDQLGYITMDSNERSGFQARELKSIPIQKCADFIKLDLRECRKNPHNPHNQVGIVGIRVLGMGADEEEMPEKKDMEVLHDRENPLCSNIPAGNSTSLCSNGLPVNKFELPSPLPTILPENVKHELDPKIQYSVDKLERLKKARAALEVFSLISIVVCVSCSAFIIKYHGNSFFPV